jgi:hypothetical protein
MAATKHEMAKNYQARLAAPEIPIMRASTALGFARHLNRRPDSVFESVRVVGRGLFSIGKVHAIVAGAHLAQREPEMARDRFSFLVRHVNTPSMSIRWRIAS